MNIMPKIARRALPALLLAGTARAAWSPSRTVTIITGFPAGGSSDIAARIAAPKLGAVLGQPVVVENRPGAGGTVALEHLRHQPADGQVVVLADASSLVIAPLVSPQMVRFRPTEDFTPLAVWGATPMVLVVRPDHPARDLAGLVGWLRDAGGAATYASSGTGSTPQLAAELFLQRAGNPPVLHVPYRGGAPMIEAVLKGEVGFGFAVLSSANGQIRAGLVRALAVSGSVRASAQPDVPTMAEAGMPGFDLTTWYLLVGPLGWAAEVQAGWSGAMAVALQDPATARRLAESGLEPAAPAPTGAAAAFLAAETARYRAIVSAAGARLAN